LIVGGWGSYDLEQLYIDFPNIKELVGQCHAGALPRKNGQEEAKRKRAADEQDQLQAKKLQAHKEEENDEEE
jgi:hypothetical protein